ncbi:MAG: lipopolysaccharide heptosyltransferase II [Nitrospirota bacterium]|nr:lipopolysaccharide heptosyltransferase II [Nitrospirota bacterium]
MRILIRSVNWLGDAVLTLPTIRGLKQLYPDASLSVLAKPFLESLFRMVPEVDEVLRLEGGRLAISRELRRRRFDFALVLPNSFDSAFVPFLAGIPQRVGYRTDGRGVLLTRRIDREDGFERRHQVYYYYRLLREIGKDLPAEPETTAPWIVPPDEGMKWAESFLREGGYDGGPLVGINPGATYGPAKCWFPERYVETANRLKAQGTQIVFFGGPGEADYVAEIGRKVPGSINAAGKTDLVQLAALLKKCRMLLTNDTGPMHLSAAVGTPVVALFGSTNPVTTGPFGEGHRIIRHAVECSPCLLRVCNRNMECFRAVEVDEVVGEILSRLKTSG